MHSFHWICTSLRQKARFFGPDAPNLIHDNSISEGHFHVLRNEIQAAAKEVAEHPEDHEVSDITARKRRRNKAREEKKRAKKAAKKAARRARKGKETVSYNCKFYIDLFTFCKQHTGDASRVEQDASNDLAQELADHINTQVPTN